MSIRYWVNVSYVTLCTSFLTNASPLYKEKDTVTDLPSRAHHLHSPTVGLYRLMHCWISRHNKLSIRETKLIVCYNHDSWYNSIFVTHHIKTSASCFRCKIWNSYYLHNCNDTFQDTSQLKQILLLFVFGLKLVRSNPQIFYFKRLNCDNTDNNKKNMSDNNW